MAETLRTQQLRNLAGQLPAANQQVATGLQEARKAQLQQNIAQAQTPAGPAAAQQLGAQAQQQAGQAQLAAAQQTANQQVQMGQLGLQQQARGQRQATFDQEVGLNALQQKLGDKLSQIDRKAQKQILNANLSFKMDEAGRALMNNTQLLDWAVLNAKSDEDLAGKFQQMDQVYQRKIDVLQAAANRLEQSLRQGYTADKQKLDSASRQRILERAQAIKLQIENEQNNKNNQLMKMQAIGTIAGGAVGSIFGPAGTAVGMGVGGAAGTWYAGAGEGQQQTAQQLGGFGTKQLYEGLGGK